MVQHYLTVLQSVTLDAQKINLIRLPKGFLPQKIWKNFPENTKIIMELQTPQKAQQKVLLTNQGAVLNNNEIFPAKVEEDIQNCKLLKVIRENSSWGFANYIFTKLLNNFCRIPTKILRTIKKSSIKNLRNFRCSSNCSSGYTKSSSDKNAATFVPIFQKNVEENPAIDENFLLKLIFVIKLFI